MILGVYLVVVLGLMFALLPTLMVVRNLERFLPPEKSEPKQDNALPRRISVLIPARNEAAGIAKTIHAVLGNQEIQCEVIVLDDASSDATADIVSAMAQRDSRVRLISGTALPAGWNGKQYACYQLASAATHEEIMFMDADVRLEPDALCRLIDSRRRDALDLLSVFPRQVTMTFWEQLLIPMMHYLLLGYLPLDRMRQSTDPAFAAGCGQLFLTTKDAYDKAGTHQAIAGSRHDGIKLPRAYRNAHLRTDVMDGTPIASCRMYTSRSEVFQGLLKNAYEGIANPKLIGIFTVLLLGGSVLPLLSFVGVMWLWLSSVMPFGAVLLSLAFAGLVLSHVPRVLCAKRFQQSTIGAALHTLATTVFVALQWVALKNHMRGRQVAWRGRVES